MAGDKLIAVNVSIGELIDKITILEIKAEHFEEPDKLRHVRHELQLLQAARDGAVEPSAQLEALTAELKAVNRQLWRIEDAIRLCEHRKDFGPEFVELARSVYRNNDRRCAIKRQMNELAGSALVEEKSYAPYE
jgi:hypothetical protein